MDSALSKLARHLAQGVSDSPYHQCSLLMVYHYPHDGGDVRHESEGRACFNQQLYDLGWGGIHRHHCFTHTIEPFNPQLKYQYSHFPAPPSHLKLTARPGRLREAA